MSNQEMQQQPVAVSIIVPVYNVEEWVADCLHSILAQSSIRVCEILVVDDCSSDNSRQICSDFQRANPDRLRLIECGANGGVSRARNLGLETMQGEYFMFVDPDDRLPADAVEQLYRAARESGACIVKGNNDIFGKSSQKPARYNVEHSALISGDAVLTTLYRHERVRGHTWGKLFRRDSLGNCRFAPGVRMVEDLLYCCETFAAADSLYLLNQTIYHYRNRETGAKGSKYENGSYLEWLDIMDRIGRFARGGEQVRAYRNLLIRTMTQMARECRSLAPDLAREVLPVIREHCLRWNIRLTPIFVQGLGLHALGHYVKMRLALRQIEHRVSGCN